MKLQLYQQGGQLPQDYNQFLEYSKTAPENRRPDSAWKYGDPTQYDHYGMWEALGKPKDFQTALKNNPNWTPNPQDGLYHGFSVNPNTGVWLKSYNQEGRQPGDTGWRELLYHTLNSAGKENIIYDTDLKRLRYIPKEKIAYNQKGGTQDYMSDFRWKPNKATLETFKLYSTPTPKPVEIVATASTPKYRNDIKSRKEDVQKIPNLSPQTMRQFPGSVQKEYMRHLVAERPNYKALEKFVNLTPTLVGPLPFVDNLLGFTGKGIQKLMTKTAQKALTPSEQLLKLGKNVPERKITSEELLSLNKELQDRGILKVQEKRLWPESIRRRVHDQVYPFGYTEGGTPVQKLKASAKYMLEGKTNPYWFEHITRAAEYGEDAKAAAQGLKNRDDQWSMYLGLPTKNQTYRVSPLSTNKKIVYTINPENILNDQGINYMVHEPRITRGALRTHNTAYNPKNIFHHNVVDTDELTGTMGYYNHSENLLGDKAHILMQDTWDLHPFSDPFKELSMQYPKILQKLEMGKATGLGKPFDVKMGLIFDINDPKNQYNVVTKKSNAIKFYQKGGINLSPVVVYGRNDPAFKAYQDSLSLYNLGRNYNTKTYGKLRGFTLKNEIYNYPGSNWTPEMIASEEKYLLDNSFVSEKDMKKYNWESDDIERQRIANKLFLKAKSTGYKPIGYYEGEGYFPAYKKPTNPPIVKPVPKMNPLLNISPSQVLSKRETVIPPKPQNYTDHNFYFGNALAWKDPNKEVGYYNLGDKHGRQSVTLRELMNMEPISRKDFLNSFGKNYNEQFEESLKSFSKEQLADRQ